MGGLGYVIPKQRIIRSSIPLCYIELEDESGVVALETSLSDLVELEQCLP